MKSAMRGRDARIYDVDANEAIYTKAQAPSVRFVNVFVANLLMLYVDNKSSGV